MLYHCLKCRKDAENKNPKAAKSKKGRIMLSSKCAVCDDKKSGLMKNQEDNYLVT